MDVSAFQYIGHSHLVLFAQRALQRGLSLSALDLRRITLFDEQCGNLAPAIAEAVAGRDVVSFIGGNAHNIVGLLRHPTPYDFAMPGDDAPVDRAARVIPYALMREMLASHRHLATYLRALELIAPLATRLIQVESPPPARDDAQIIARPNRYFVEHNIASVGIAPPLLRRKLWKLHSSIIKARCAALGATFLGAPEAAIEDDFLRPEFFRDATHANGAYVDLVLQQLEAL